MHFYNKHLICLDTPLDRRYIFPQSGKKWNLVVMIPASNQGRNQGGEDWGDEGVQVVR